MASVYERVLVFELRRRGLDARMPVSRSIEDEGLVLELVHEAELISHLEMGAYPLGLLIGFHVPKLRDGSRRFAN